MLSHDSQTNFLTYTEDYLETDSLDQFLVFRPSQEEKTLDMVLHTHKLATGTVDIQNLY